MGKVKKPLDSKKKVSNTKIKESGGIKKPTNKRNEPFKAAKSASRSITKTIVNTLKREAKPLQRKSVGLKSSTRNKRANKILKKGAEDADKEKEVGSLLKNPLLQKFDHNQAEQAAKALLDFISKTEKKKELFDEEKPIHLQIACIKVPKTPSRILRFSLQNPLFTSESEICLIVSDFKKMKRSEHDEAIEFYENFLKQKGITNIKTIMPLHQLKTEYSTYELRRRLVELYDLFLVEGKISGRVFHFLGKVFLEKRKNPVPVKLDVPNIKAQIDNAFSKVQLNLHSKGDSFLLQVGHSKMEAKKIAENIISVSDELERVFPGGWDNIRGLYLKTANSLSIPIYVTLKNKNKVHVPVVKAKRPKAFKAVTGELTTIQRDVTVLPTGEVIYSTDLESQEEDAKSEPQKQKKGRNKSQDEKKPTVPKFEKKKQKEMKARKQSPTKAKQKEMKPRKQSPTKATQKEIKSNKQEATENGLEKEEQLYLQQLEKEHAVVKKDENIKNVKQKKVTNKAKKTKDALKSKNNNNTVTRLLLPVKKRATETSAPKVPKKRSKVIKVKLSGIKKPS